MEFAITVPVFMLLLLGMLEFGFAFTHDQTIAYATREGARTGAALGSGSTTYPCTTPDFDAPIIAAVERVLTSSGSPIAISRVSEIDVYLAKPDGSQTAGSVNRWLPAPASGPVVDGKSLDFKTDGQRVALQLQEQRRGRRCLGRFRQLQLSIRDAAQRHPAILWRIRRGNASDHGQDRHEPEPHELGRPT